MESDSREEFKSSITNQTESDEELDSVFSASDKMQLQLLREQNRHSHEQAKLQHEQDKLNAQRSWFNVVFGCTSNAVTLTATLTVLSSIIIFTFLTIGKQVDGAATMLALGSSALGYMFGKSK